MNWAIVIAISLSVLCLAEGNIIELTNETFDATIDNNEVVLVEYYSPQCGHCIAFAPDYEKVADTIKETHRSCLVTKINSRLYRGKTRELSFMAYPGIALFINGVGELYKGELTAELLLAFIDKRVFAPSTELKSENEVIAKSKESKSICIFAGSDKSKFDAYIKVAKKEDKYDFYHSSIELVKKAFPSVAESNVVILANEDEKIFKGDVESSNFTAALEDFLIPAVILADSDIIDTVFKPKEKKSVCLFFNQRNKNIKNMLIIFKTVARSMREANFRFAAIDVEFSWGTYYSGLYSIEASSLPVLEILDDREDMLVYRYTDEFTEEGIKKFLEAYTKGELKRYIKSAPEPTENPGPIYEIVGSTFERDILNVDKDAILLHYGPKCERCDKILDVFLKLAKDWKSDDKIIFAKVDISTNDIQGHLPQVYPVIKLFPAKDKSKPETFKKLYNEDDIKEFIKAKSSHPHGKPKKKGEL